MGLFPSTYSLFGEYEGQKIGLTFDKINEKVANYTFSFGLLALVFDLVFFSMLSLYLEKVLPHARMCKVCCNPTTKY